MKRFVTFLCVLSLLLSMAAAASAAGTVTYDGNADEFIFAPGTEESPTSLFENFRNVMPGDTLTEEIVIKNDVDKEVKVRVYMRSLGAQEGTEDFLSQMNLRVTQKGDSVLFAAPADQTAQLTDWVYLGTVYSGGEITLEVTLEVPITMGNDFQNRVGYLDWQFMIEELPIDPDDPLPPQTGDTSNIVLVIAIMGISLLALIVLLVILGRKKGKGKFTR